MSMEVLSQNANSSDRLNGVPTSTSQELEHGHAIISDELGSDFWLIPQLPRHVGSKGDDRLYGETVLIDSDNPEAARALYADDANLARVSTRITNEMPAVVKVLYNPFGNGIRD